MKRDALVSMGRSVTILFALFCFLALHVHAGPTASDCMHDLVADEGMPAVIREYCARFGQLMRERADKIYIEQSCTFKAKMKVIVGSLPEAFS